MEENWRTRIDAILSVGHSLESSGIKGWALTRTQALIALTHLAAEGVGIWGGDVYVRGGDSIRPTYDNWFSDAKPDEAGEAFVARSIEHTRRYISSYEEGNETIFYVLVPTFERGSLAAFPKRR